MSVQIEAGAGMTLEQVETTREWQLLRAKQRMWIVRFIDTGNPFEATKMVYDCKSAKNAQIQMYQVLESPRVQTVLNMISGRSDRDTFVDALEKRLKISLQGKGPKLTVAEKDSLKLLFAARGWSQPELAAETRHQTGDIVSQNGFSYRVTSVDANGKILKAEPVAEVR